MVDEKKLKKAREVYTDLCKALDDDGWKYAKDEDELRIDAKATGDDLPIDFSIVVVVPNEVVQLFSYIPFITSEDKRLDVAVAVSVINNQLADGSFDYDVVTGKMFFRMTSSYMESSISGEVFKYLVYCSCHTIDAFNDKLLMLAKGMISLEKFIEMNN